jgi:hypothetical protein
MAALDVIVTVAQNGETMLRLVAIMTYVQTGGEYKGFLTRDTIDNIITVLGDPDADLRKAAVWALIALAHDGEP